MLNFPGYPHVIHVHFIPVNLHVMASCSARGCANNSRTTPNLSFFRCPNDPDLSGQWILESEKQYVLGMSLAECSEGHPFQCPECGKGLKSKRGLKFHLQLHVCQTPFKCLECDNCFIDKKSLIQHRYLKHKESLQCPECNKVFSDKASLNQHWYLVHVEDYRGLRNPYKDYTTREAEKIWFCGQHFESCMFTDERRDKLLPDATPTLFDAPLRISTDEKYFQPSDDEECERTQYQLMEGNIRATTRAKVYTYMSQTSFSPLFLVMRLSS